MGCEHMADWNAQLYNQYGNERKQPVIDLINRLDNPFIKRIIDIGCGSGISTIPLKERWKQAEIVGVDNSESMLEDARQKSNEISWLKRDCNDSLEDLGKFDLVFSNAVLQWLPDQDNVIGNLSRLLTKQGVLAVQIPSFNEMPINNCINKAAAAYPGNEFAGIEQEVCSCHSPHYYYDVLSKYFTEIDLWQTNYYHIMNSHEDILNFCKSTGLRPFLNRLDLKGQEIFLSEVLREIEAQYITQKNGKVLFEFKRVFFIAKV